MSNCNEDDLNILVQGKVDFVKKSNPGTRNFMSMQQNVVIQKIWWINVCCDDWQAVLCKKNGKYFRCKNVLSYSIFKQKTPFHFILNKMFDSSSILEEIKEPLKLVWVLKDTSHVDRCKSYGKSLDLL